MNDIKLIKLLKSFSTSEFSEFEKFVDSPFFRTGRNLSDFFKCIKPFYPEFDHKNFSEEKIFRKLFPGKKFDSKTSVNLIHKLSSELLKLCKEYLIQIELRNDESRKYFYLLNKLREKKLYSEFEKEYKNSETDKENPTKGGVNDFLNKYYLTHSYLEYTIDKGNLKEVFDSILSLGEYTVAAALTKGYRNSDTNNASSGFNVKTRYNLVDTFVKHLNSEKLLEELEKNNDRFYPYIAISHAIHQMTVNNEMNEFYFRYKELVNKHLNLFGRSELYILFKIMINYCINRLNTGESELFLKEEFSVLKQSYKLGVYKYNEHDKISLNSFREIIISAIENNEIDWLEKFVEENIKEVHSEYQENMKYYSYALIYLEKKEYEKSLENIIKVKYDFFLFKMDVKIIMFRLYFELELYDQAYSIIDTMKHYIANTKDLSDSSRSGGLNFTRYATALLKAKTGNKKIDLKMIKDKIRDEKYLKSRNWFLTKLSQI